jgi:hypothetical protein
MLCRIAELEAQLHAERLRSAAMQMKIVELAAALEAAAAKTC